jgi:glycosyltransferase involved in cell wall biosynthesis
VVVPTFNNLPDNRHIANIQSILAQNYHNYHVVVIDDASTDGTGQQIKDYL